VRAGDGELEERAKVLKGHLGIERGQNHLL